MKPAHPFLEPLRPYAGRVVVVGLSGGADSVALLRGLLLVGAKPVAAHFDHALRPDSARDAEWVAVLAAELGVPFETVRVEVGAVAKKRGWNIEDAARRLRYDFLARVAKTHAASAILTAHTQRDQAETVLMRLLRGEAVLHGIARRWGRVERPLLQHSRAELENFLHGLGQMWREDPTNADPAQTRAFLRHRVMPVLEQRFAGSEAALAQHADFAAEDEAALNAMAAQVQPHAPLPKLPPAVLRRWVRQELARRDMGFGAKHLAQIAQAIRTGQTQHFTLPAGVQVTVTGGKLHFGDTAYPAPDFAFPADWVLRFRQDGDRIRLRAGSRKLSDVLTDAKIPRAERDRVPLLVSPQGVQWVGTRPPMWAVGAREQVSLPPDPSLSAMDEALALARQAAAQQEVPVGAVVLDAAGRVVGRGRNTSRSAGDMTQHAELLALREAAQTLGTPYLTDCTLVVTLEPCPMCLGAALEARVGKIVYGAGNPKAGALGGVTDLLTAHWGHRPQVVSGVRAAEAAQLLREAFQGWRE